MTFWSCKYSLVANLPLRVQAQTIKNTGSDTIYLCTVEDDLPLDRTSMLAYSQIILLQGQSVDLTSHPYLNGIQHHSFPDCDITIHSLQDVSVDITSHDICERWIGDIAHPWSGGHLPGGGYTNKFKSASNQFAAITAAIQSGMTNMLNSTFVNKALGEDLDRLSGFNDMKIKPKCTCGIASLRSGGRHSSWCDLEKK